MPKADDIANIPECDHEWQKFKETIRSERTFAQLDQGFDYRGGPAYLIVKACLKCKKKQILDYKREN